MPAGRLIRLSVVALMALLLVACRDDSGRSGKPGDTGATARPPGSHRPAQPRGIATAPAPSSPLERAEPPVDDVADGVDADDDLDCAPAGAGLKPLQLLRFTFAPAVENKDPVGKLNVARPGQRVWAHLRVRNRSGRDRCLHVVFRIGGQARTELDLKVGESWNWRTYAYATPRSSDRSGVVEFEATDDQGNLIVKKRLPIVPEPN